MVLRSTLSPRSLHLYASCQLELDSGEYQREKRPSAISAQKITHPFMLLVLLIDLIDGPLSSHRCVVAALDTRVGRYRSPGAPLLMHFLPRKSPGSFRSPIRSRFDPDRIPIESQPKPIGSCPMKACGSPVLGRLRPCILDADDAANPCDPDPISIRADRNQARHPARFHKTERGWHQCLGECENGAFEYGIFSISHAARLEGRHEEFFGGFFTRRCQNRGCIERFFRRHRMASGLELRNDRIHIGTLNPCPISKIRSDIRKKPPR